MQRRKQENPIERQRKPAEPITTKSQVRLALSPLRDLTLITEQGASELSKHEISIGLVGLKAYGLSSIPADWVPPFLVVSASCCESALPEDTINTWVMGCLKLADGRVPRRIMVRSSGTVETIRSRGQLPSASCCPREIGSTIRHLSTQLPGIRNDQVHWVVQEYIDSYEKGHLSNERRLKFEKRDWAIEFEPKEERFGYTSSMGIRPWRDGRELLDLSLSCASHLEISLRLRRVAMWATKLPSRTHFEWVWDGRAVHIVQVDAESAEPGVNPRTLVPERIAPVHLSSLRVFRSADNGVFSRYGKLRNARLYGELGYEIPKFFVLDDQKVLRNIFAGRFPHKLESDLEELTKRPLILRTDGVNIPEDKREMLPRSEELRSATEARKWLINEFKVQVEQNQLEGRQLCIIAHHFIPSVASAWARAEPGSRLVRIESLWGIPEGLYWYSHDTFEVDTQTVNVNRNRSASSLDYEHRDHKRYKGRFIAPDADGNWIPYRTVAPYDWALSIRKKEWLFEIARTSRLIAEHEKHAVSVMWFVDNHPDATIHKLLPWFHSKSELAETPKAAPRRKRKSANDYTIKTVADWERFQEFLRAGPRIERVIVEPIEPELIRNPRFARELARLAALHKIVVELSGGILSHVYYVLHSHGAHVECMDLFGADEEIVEFDKVVRDKIPTLIEGRGERVETVRLVGDALVTALRQKLVEEAFEALDAKSGEELIAEFADVEEVILGLCQALKIDPSTVEFEREQKRRRRGGFNKGVLLTRTTTPQSIPKERTFVDPPDLGLRSGNADRLISSATSLPSKPPYRRPDLRQVNAQLEKMLTFQTELSHIGNKVGGEFRETLHFSLPIDDRLQDFTLSVELRRIGSSIRTVARLRSRPSQLHIQFPDAQLELDFGE